MHEPPLEGVHDQVVVGAAAVHREDVARRGEARIEEGLPPLELDRVRGLGPHQRRELALEIRVELLDARELNEASVALLY